MYATPLPQLKNLLRVAQHSCRKYLASLDKLPLAGDEEACRRLVADGLRACCDGLTLCERTQVFFNRNALAALQQTRRIVSLPVFLRPTTAVAEAVTQKLLELAEIIAAFDRTTLDFARQHRQCVGELARLMQSSSRLCGLVERRGLVLPRLSPQLPADYQALVGSCAGLNQLLLLLLDTADALHFQTRAELQAAASSVSAQCTEGEPAEAAQSGIAESFAAGFSRLSAQLACGARSQAELQEVREQCAAVLARIDPEGK